MNSSFIDFLINIYILIIILILSDFSLIFCQKSLALKSNGQKGVKKTQTPNKSNPKEKLLDTDTTISEKLSAEHGKKWHYGSKWPASDNSCGGEQQSPIRLMTSIAVRNRSLHFTLRNYNRLIRQAFIENNGHTVQIGFKDKFKARLYGTATNYNTYEFAQLHFHWGSNSRIGSEHTVDGYRGPMEVHLVHFNIKYGTADKASTQPDGLMVLGALFKTSSRNNQFFREITQLVRNVPKYKDKSTILGSFTLGQLLPARKRPFYMYSGSLTTPPCSESVQWLVFKNRVPIGNAQEKQFRKCRGEYVNSKTGKKRLISNNYRPIQALNERQIIIST